MYSNHHIVVTCIPKNLSLMVTVAMSLIAGCTGHSAPESVYQEFILYSLDPFLPVDGPPVPKDQAFHGHRILGQIRITDSEQQMKLLEALEQGFAESDGGVSKCWFPRHGLRTSAGDSSIEYVICFSCQHAYKYAMGTSQMKPVTASPRDTFNNVLESHRIPVAD